MKELPILFSPLMVQAILGGRKTQTRRIAKISEPIQHPDPRIEGLYTVGCKGGSYWLNSQTSHPNHISKACPYGQPADYLWLREEHYCFGHWETVPGVRTKTGRMKWAFVPDSAECLFEAPAEFRKGRHHKDPSTPAWHKRLARFMPRGFSRITLEIVDVRVERLNNIKPNDCVAEGAWLQEHVALGRSHEALEAFKTLWESINGDGSWAQNPWVWVIEFQRITP